MCAKHIHKGMDKTYYNTLLVALGSAMLCILLGSMLLSTFLISEVLEVNHKEIGSAVVLFASAITASLLLKVKIGEGSKGAILILLSVVGGVLLLLNIIILGGTFDNAVLKMCSVVLGGSVLMFGGKGKTKRNKRRKNR